MRRLLALFAALMLAALFMLAPGAQAAGAAGSIDGSLVEQTHGASLKPGAKAFLYRMDGQQPKQQATTSVDASGHFRFGKLSTDPAAVYEVGVQYQGAPYFSNRITFAAGKSSHSIRLAVYEPTVDDKPLSIDATSLLVDPNQKTHELGFLELDAFVNNSDRMFIPNTTPRNGGPPNLLRFTLPPNATNLTAGEGLDPSEIIQISSGFGALAPLLPGRQELGFTFSSAYQTSSFSFTKSVIYPTKSFRILLPAGSAQVSSPQLQRQPNQTIGGKQFELLMGTNLAPGAKIELRFSSLPGISPLAGLSQPGTLPWVAGVLAAAALGLLAWYARDRRRASKSPTESSEPDGRQRLEQERRDLLIALARLDDRYDAGAISPDDYRLQRDEQKAELRSLMQRLEALGQR